MEVKFEESGTPLKRSKNRHGETCEQQLRRMVKDIAMGINSPEEGETASSWMDNTYDIRYLVSSDKSFMGAEILVAGGGPTIWVDTFREQVTGWWGTDRVQWYFQDNLGLNEYCEEMYGC